MIKKRNEMNIYEREERKGRHLTVLIISVVILLLLIAVKLIVSGVTNRDVMDEDVEIVFENYYDTEEEVNEDVTDLLTDDFLNNITTMMMIAMGAVVLFTIIKTLFGLRLGGF